MLILCDRTAGLWTALIITSLPYYIVTMGMITSPNIAINNSVEVSRAGSANGMAVMISCMFRAFGSLIGSSIYQWSAANQFEYPLDVNLAFQLCGVVIIMCGIIVYKLPVYLEHRDKAQNNTWLLTVLYCGRLPVTFLTFLLHTCTVCVKLRNKWLALMQKFCERCLQRWQVFLYISHKNQLNQGKISPESHSSASQNHRSLQSSLDLVFLYFCLLLSPVY